MTFNIQGKTIENVTSFKYLGRVLSADDDDLPAIVANIRKARNRWVRSLACWYMMELLLVQWDTFTRPSSKQFYCMVRIRGLLLTV